METLKEKAAKGLFWGGLSNVAQQVIGLVFGICLLRLLTQEDYGMVGMLTIFSAVAAALQEGGFISALNKKKEATQQDYNAVFWFSLLCSLCVYVILFLSAPLIAEFFHEPVLIPLSRYVFVGFVITSLGIAPRAWLFRNLKNKEAAIISFTALLISNIVGVGMAWYGMAYWGIATQSILYVALFTILSYWFSGWHPSMTINLHPLSEMIGFSSRLIITNLFNILNTNLLAVLFGRYYGKAAVGNYTQASKWTNMGSVLIINMLSGIAQPVFTKVDDIERQKKVFRKLLRFTAFAVFPTMLGLCIVSEELIVITATAKWLSCVPFMQLLCISATATTISTLFSNLLISRGRSDIYMWSTILLCIVQWVVVLAARPWGIMVMLYIYVTINILWLIVWWYFSYQEIKLRLLDTLRDIAPYLLLTVALTFSAYLFFSPIESLWLRMLGKIIYVAGLYAGILHFSGSVIFHESIDYLLHKHIKN